MLVMQKSKDGLLLLSLVFIIVLVIFSTLIFYAEQTVQTYDDNKGAWVRPDGSVR